MSDFLPISQIPANTAQYDSKVEKMKTMASRLGEKDVKNPELMKAAQEFESFLTFTMLKTMREAIPKSDLLKSSAEGIYQSMLDQEITKTASQRQNGMGIAEMIYKQFSQNGPKIE